MKNIIKIKSLANIDFDLVTEAGDNSIWIQAAYTGEIEFFYQFGFSQKITIPAEGLLQIPEEIVHDGSIVHFRFQTAAGYSGFVHVVGNEGGYTDLILSKKSSCLLTCEEESNGKIETDWLTLLARLISSHTKMEVKACYLDLRSLENEFNNQLGRLGGDPGTTVEESVENLKKIDPTGGNVKTYVKIDSYINMQMNHDAFLCKAE